MTPIQGADGGVKGWKTGSARSYAMSRKLEKWFRGDSCDLISFPELLASSQPYSVLVVSSFYTDPMPIKDPAEGGPDE